MVRRKVTIDGNEAVAHVAYQINEVIAIYPITPSSTMGELADQWASQHRPNLWGTVPRVVEMQSEGGRPGPSMARFRPVFWRRPSRPPRGSSCWSPTCTRSPAS